MLVRRAEIGQPKKEKQPRHYAKSYGVASKACTRQHTHTQTKSADTNIYINKTKQNDYSTRFCMHIEDGTHTHTHPCAGSGERASAKEATVLERFFYGRTK